MDSIRVMLAPREWRHALVAVVVASVFCMRHCSVVFVVVARVPWCGEPHLLGVAAERSPLEEEEKQATRWQVPEASEACTLEQERSEAGGQSRKHRLCASVAGSAPRGVCRFWPPVVHSVAYHRASG